MTEPIRYYMDQHYPLAVTEGLRRRGIDVLTAQEADRCGLADPKKERVFQEADDVVPRKQSSGRVIGFDRLNSLSPRQQIRPRA